MGCDIHAFEETFKTKWEYTGEVDLWRNYTLFTVLANVRSGSDRVKIISTPKGVPDDISDYVKSELSGWMGDGHSHSWLTKQEFEEFDWESEVKMFGVVDVENYKEYKEKGSPSSWCAGVGGPKIKIVSVEEMEEVIKLEKTDFSYYCSISWNDLLKNYVEEAYNTLKNVFSSVEEKRIIFWFDN